MIASRNLERVQAAADKLNRSPGISGDPVMALQTNIRKPEEVKTMVATTLSRFKRLDILVNNAGGQFPGPLAGVSPKGWHAVIDTNLTATKTCLIEAYEQWMRDNSGGRIINIIACVERGFPNMARTLTSSRPVFLLSFTFPQLLFNKPYPLVRNRFGRGPCGSRKSDPLTGH